MANYVFFKTSPGGGVDTYSPSDGKAVHVNAKMGERYELRDAATGRAPAKLKVKHAGKHVVFEVDGQPQAVIHDYFRDEAAISEALMTDAKLEVTTDKGLVSIDTNGLPVAQDSSGSVLFDSGTAVGAVAESEATLGATLVAGGAGIPALGFAGAAGLVGLAALGLGGGGSSSKSSDKSATTPGSNDKSATDQSSADKSATDQSSADKSATDQSSADKSATDQSSADKSATDQSSADKPATDQPGADKSPSDPTTPTDKPKVAAHPLGALTVQIQTGDGVVTTEKVNAKAQVKVSGIELGATWQYSLDDGVTWHIGPVNNTILVSALGSDGDKKILVRQADADENFSPNTEVHFTLDATPPVAPSLALNRVTGTPTTYKLTNEGLLNVGNLESTAIWEYSLDEGVTWKTGVGKTIPAAVLGDDGVKTVLVRQTDTVGNVSDTTFITFVLDTTPPPAPSTSLVKDTGSSDSDRITNDGSVHISGLVSGTVWEYSLDGTNWVTGVGNTIASNALGADGVKTVRVRQSDAAGNLQVGTPLTFTLDTTGPAAPKVALQIDTGISATDKLTKNGTLNISGLENGASWEYSLDGMQWIAGTGNMIPGSGLGGDGAKTVHVRQIDLAGNTSPSVAFSFTLDTVAPTTAPTVTLAQESGPGPGVTSAPTVNVSGLEAGATWEWRVDSGTWIAGTGSSFNLTLGVHSYEVRQLDAAGNVSAPKVSSFTLEPAPGLSQTAAITSVSDDVGVWQNTLPTGRSTDDTKLALSGTLSAAPAAGDKLAVYDGANRLGYAIIFPGMLTWTFTPDIDLLVGRRTLTVRFENDTSGLKGAVSPSFVINENTVTITNADDQVGGVKGNVASGSTIDDHAPSLSGKLGSVLGADEQVGIYDGSTRLGTATVNTAGTGWTFTPGTSLSDGLHDFNAKIELATGNTPLIASANYSLTLLTGPTTAPTQTVTITSCNDNQGAWTGALPAGQSTDDSTLSFVGTLSAPIVGFDRVAVYDGATRLGFATVNGLEWTYTTENLAYGRRNITARVENSANSLSGPVSDAFVVTENGITISGITDGFGSITGVVGVGKTIDDHRPVIAGSVAVALGAAEQVGVYDGSTRLGTATIDSTGRGWSFTPSTALGDGAHNFTAKIELVENNTALVTTETGFGVTILTPSPNEPAQLVTFSGATDNVGVWKKTIIHDNSTDDTSLQLFGKLSASLGAGEQLVVYDGATRLGVANVTGTDWGFGTTNLTVGKHTFTGKVENLLTGLNGASTAGFSITENTITVSSVYDARGAANGRVASGSGTYEDHFTITATLGAPLPIGADEIVSIYNGTNFVGVATADPGGMSYSLQVAGQSIGQHSYRAQIEQSNGDPLVVSAGNYTLTINERPLTVTFDSLTDNAGRLTGTVLSGGVTDDRSAVLRGTLGGRALKTGESLHIYDGEKDLGAAVLDSNNANWTYTMDGTVTYGDHNLTARVQTDSGALVVKSDTVGVNFVTNNLDSPSYFNIAHDSRGDIDIRALTVSAGLGSRVLDITSIHEPVEIVHLAEGPTTVKLTANAAQLSQISGISALLGLSDTVSGGRRQLLIEGDANDTIQLDSTAQAGTWTSAGQVTANNHQYDVYNNSNGTVQILIDHLIKHSTSGAI